jgi:hypothetical protein
MSRTALASEYRMCAAAAGALAFTLILPWYSKSFFATTGARPVAVSDNLSALGVFSFVEAAVLLVAGGVLYLVYARYRRKAFHLPGGDGTVIAAAGGWALLLLVWRLFDKPDVDDPGATVGIAWGMFVALLAAGALLASGLRLRAAHRPEPPNPAADDIAWERPARERVRRRTAVGSTAVTEALRDRPTWEGEPPEAPGRTERRGEPDPGSPELPDAAPDDGDRQDRLF